MRFRSENPGRRIFLSAGLALALAVAPVLGADASDENGLAMIHAAELGDADAVARFLGIGTAVDSRDSSGRTALLAATHGNHVETARILIEAGADVNVRDAIADSPFLYAAAEGRLEILRLTLKAGADLRSVNRYGGTGLIPAAHHGHVEVVHELLKTGIAIDHVNNLGWTALLEAVILGDGSEAYIAIVQALVEAGADIRIADRQGNTPIEHARRRGFREIAGILERAGGR